MLEPEESRYFDALDAAFERTLAPYRSAGAPLTLLYSGGVDSSLLAWELRSRTGLVLLTVGTPESPDLAAGRSGAELLGLPWTPAVVNAADADRMVRAIADDLRGTRAVTRTVLLALALAIERCPTPQALVGQGADELFLGYAHFRGLDREQATARAEADLARLHEEDWPHTLEIAARLGHTVTAPFLDADYVAVARSVPIELRLPGGEPKRFFRDWALRRGLPEEIAARPKRAMQYGSGVDRLRRRRPA